ncbi:hypothetical protein L3Y34_013658 [Caenorhabditis briggsae]|uniref:Uncharacterized protein n=1 Tax=Caenorhabditis briggsae TaxID=6238 RepID=A0AAE9CWX2_CAEBR|nr:hypothetical protein L3Y34_013658 [Caenorhabditis briggsae]
MFVSNNDTVTAASTAAKAILETKWKCVLPWLVLLSLLILVCISVFFGLLGRFMFQRLRNWRTNALRERDITRMIERMRDNSVDDVKKFPGHKDHGGLMESQESNDSDV